MTGTRTKLFAMAAVGMLVLAGFPATAVAQSSLAVATGNASAVTEDDATLHGNLTDLGHSANASVWFTYWRAADPANTTQATTPVAVNTTGPFNESVSGLAPNTRYEFQAHAEGSSGNTSTGAIVSFTTEEEEAPTVRTGSASNVTTNAAVLAGNLTDLGDSVNASVWFRYWVASDPANTTDTAPTTVNATGPFNESVSGLMPNTTYEFQAYAEGSTGDVANGSIGGFTTSAADSADGLSIGVKQGAARVTISVTDAENATAVPGANVSVTSSDTYNGTGEYVTGDDGTVSIPAPDGNRTVTITISAEADGKTGERTVTITGTDGQGPAQTPFGLKISSFIQSLKGLGVDGPLGQVISSFAKANNPGADNKPDHAGGSDEALDALFGDEDDGNETDDDRGPPEHAGPKDDENETEAAGSDSPGQNNGNGQGPPDHAKNDGNESDTDEDDSDDEVDDESSDQEDDSDDEDAEDDESDNEDAEAEESDDGEDEESDESEDDNNGQANGNGNGNGGGNNGNGSNGNGGGNGNGR